MTGPHLDRQEPLVWLLLGVMSAGDCAEIRITNKSSSIPLSAFLTRSEQGPLPHDNTINSPAVTCYFASNILELKGVWKVNSASSWPLDSPGHISLFSPSASPLLMLSWRKMIGAWMDLADASQWTYWMYLCANTKMIFPPLYEKVWKIVTQWSHIDCDNSPSHIWRLWNSRMHFCDFIPFELTAPVFSFS